MHKLNPGTYITGISQVRLYLYSNLPFYGKNVEWLFQRILSIRKQMDLYRFSYESMKHRADKHVLEKRRRNK